MVDACGFLVLHTELVSSLTLNPPLYDFTPRTVCVIPRTGILVSACTKRECLHVIDPTTGTHETVVGYRPDSDEGVGNQPIDGPIRSACTLERLEQATIGAVSAMVIVGGEFCVYTGSGRSNWGIRRIPIEIRCFMPAK